MLDEYFKEVNAKKRKGILVQITPEEEGVDENYLNQVRKLFDERYQIDKKNNYVDRFIKIFLDFRFILDNRTTKISKKRNEQQMCEDFHILCLDRGEEYNHEILYREMCNVMRTYISLCQEDYEYNSVVFGLGQINEEKQKQNIESDLDLVLNLVDQYSYLLSESLILKEAIMDMQRALD